MTGAMQRNVKPIPDGYRTVTPYLTVEGVAKLMDFMKQAFDAREIYHHNGPDGKVAHAEMKIGDSIIMMGEAGGTEKPRPSTLYLYVEDMDALYRRAVHAGGVSLREPSDQFYGDRTGGIQDPSGNQWWIATHIEDVGPEELARRMAAMAPPK